MNSSLHQKSKAWLALLLLTLIWGYNWVVVKGVLPLIDVFLLTALRTGLGALMLFALLVFLKKPLNIGHWQQVTLLGLLQTTGFTGLMMWSLEGGGPGKMAVLTYTMPFWVMLFAWWFLGERLKGWQWPAAAMALIGLLLIINPLHMGADKFSVLLALASGITWALSAIVAKRLHARAPEMDLLTLTAWQMLIGSVPIVVVAWFATSTPTVWNAHTIGAVAYNILLSNMAGFTLWLYAIQRLKAGPASMGSLLAPIIGAVAAWWQLNDTPTNQELTGMCLVGLALVIISLVTIRGERG